MHRDWSIDFTGFQWKTLDCETQADTFIEWCFEQKCFELSQGDILKNEWRSRKQVYVSRLQTTIFDFQHYSRHDDTHSINILNAIELILGRNRVKMLSTSDLWLLIESAYFHDIGMALTDSQIREIWTSDEFYTYLRETLAANDVDEKRAANCYLQINNLLNDRRQLHGLDSEEKLEFSKEWPIDFRRDMSILTAAFVRKKHAQRSKEFMEEHLQYARDPKDPGVPVIKNRMNRLVALISELHGLDFTDIRKKVTYRALGFDTEFLHPQFAAAMLRLGDLLDLDNNRFNIRAMEHFGSLPVLSQYHYEKHRAVCHFSICPERIEALAISNNDHACQEIDKWFQWLKEEVENLICDWNDFAPHELKGCMLRRCRLETKFGDFNYNTEFRKNFEVDQARLIDLMAGTNIYDSKLDCFREYLQNALDASKMRLWLDIENENTDSKNKDSSRLTPFDIPREKYEEKAIEVNVTVSQKDSAQYVLLKIIDRGVGMESDCVDNLSVVGHGWKQRNLYQDEMQRMPEWLKPTGGFGIGLQSAFLLTDQVTIATRSIKESTGFEVELNAPQKGGGIVKKRKQQYNVGTTVEFKIALDRFYELIRNVEQLKLDEHKEVELHFNLPNGDVFLRNYNEEYIYAFLKYYLKEQMPDPLFPIKITSGKNSSTHRSPYASESGGYGDLKNKFLLDERYICSVSNDYSVRIWDQMEHVFVCVLGWPAAIPGFSQEKGKLLNHFCYRNVKVQNIHEKELGLQYQNFLSVCIDIMGKHTEDILSLRRNDFLPGFDLSLYYRNYLAVYVEAIYNFYSRNSKESSNISRHLNIFLYLLLAIQVLDQEKRKCVLDVFLGEIGADKCEIRSVSEKDGNDLRVELVPAEEVLRSISDVFTPQKGETDIRSPKRLFIVAKAPHPPINEVPAYSLKNINNEMIYALKEGAQIYADPAVCQALTYIGARFHMSYFSISEDSRQDRLVYASISGLHEDWNFESSVIVEQVDFLRKAFWADEGRRYLGENVDCKNYRDLRVTRLPARQQYGMHAQRIKTYLISPISGKMLTKLLLTMDIHNFGISKDSDYLETVLKDCRGLLPKYKFVEQVIEEEDYPFLISWVHQYQCAENRRFDLEEIDNLYRKMLEDMYDLIFNVGGFQNE